MPTDLETQNWYYVRDRKKVGPIPWGQLRALAAAGQLGPGDMVLHDGTVHWAEARSVSGLFPPVAQLVPNGAGSPSATVTNALPMGVPLVGAALTPTLSRGPQLGAAAPAFTARADYLRFINVFDRTVDELIAYLKCPVVNALGNCDPTKSLIANTVILYTTDNGFHITNSKMHFAENGYRTPVILYGYGNGAAGSESCGVADEPGCRSALAKSADLLATIRGVTAGPWCAGCGATLSNQQSCGQPGCNSAGPRGLAAYAEGSDLRTLTSAARACPALPTQPNPVPPGVSLGQCLFGVEKTGQGTVPANGWYVLAEVKESSSGPVHLCKLYNECDTERLYDLTCDPNERRNLWPTNAQPVDCGPGVAGNAPLCKTIGANLQRMLWTTEFDKGWITCDSCFEAGNDGRCPS